MPISSKIFHLVQDVAGINETTQEFHNTPIFCVLCDALCLTHPEKNHQISREFERVIKKYLWLQKPHLNEKTLVKALEEAQKHFLKNYAKEFIKHLKLSVLLIIEPHFQDKTRDPFLYVLGLGDFKLFQIDKSGTLIFYDPETPQLPLNLSLKKRFNCLTNVIGQNHTRTTIHKIPINVAKSLLLVSYGTYSLIPEDKWIQYTLDFENKKNLLIRSFARSKERDHLKQLLYLNLKQEEQLSQEIEQTLPPIKNEPERSPKKTFYTLNWAFKISTLLILGLCILELTQNVTARTPRTMRTLFRYLHKEPEMNLGLKSSNPKLFRLPLVRERAFVMDLKNKYERQSIVIEKLNNRIKEQDKALRDLQIKKLTSLPSTTTIEDLQIDTQSNN